MDGPIFDATKYDPQQGMAKHPVGKFPAYISATDIKRTNDETGSYFEVVYTTQAGSIAQRFNLWNNSQQAVDIAHRQLSAVCHATGVYTLDMQNNGAALLNKQLMIEVAVQEKNDKYNEVKKVYDIGGNEPKAGQAPASQPAAQQPQPAAQQQPQPAAQPAPAAASAPWTPGGGASSTAPAGGGTADNRPPWAK